MDFTPEEAVPLVLEKGTTFPIKKGAYGATDAEATWKHVEASVVAGIKRRGFKGRLVVKTRKMVRARYSCLLCGVRQIENSHDLHVDGSETKYRHGSKRPEKGRCFSKLLPLSTIDVCQHAGECLRYLIMSDVKHKLQHFSPGLFRGFSVFLITLFLGAFVCTYIAENVSQHSNFTTATFRPRVSRGTCRAGAVG